MRVTEHGDRLVVADTPGCLWLFGLMFVAGGAFAFAMPFVATNRETIPWWGRVLIGLLGTTHMTVGALWIHASPATRTELDLTAGVGRHRVRAPGSRAAVVTEFALRDVRRIDVVQGKDSDGDPTYQLGLRLATGRLLPLHAQPARGETWTTARGARVRAFLGLPERTA